MRTELIVCPNPSCGLDATKKNYATADKRGYHYTICCPHCGWVEEKIVSYLSAESLAKLKTEQI